ncbi:MAG: YebC/PmpR family DNA-binding transcriptional regulator [Planctomycetes bacterium]|nr:YebC/PmpR family DNA-binding transcriptional regulator [Planctomycetota bacterium]MBU1517930.1 YebC/PmpR family DNA-binding transcriptional regulator [Planctomycetota bacterium]MBU2458185.1 YebC/PmpR family DNA-binding transcriptional regulator [Planctomycetota bacterium]MBU2596300.1 YebC/PmpR family DNA-binding transcriptional regulator [Planctomycetota bacterium]
MSGHSHWAGIKHKKAANDAKRGKVWSKIARIIIVAAKSGGTDPSQNLTLRYAIDKAKQANMPKDTIEKAVKKGAGGGDTVAFVSIAYEGYAHGGVAIMVEALTDNRNRTAPEVRKIFERHGGSLGTTGCVNYLFNKKGLITVLTKDADENNLMEIALSAGAEDMQNTGEVYEITCEPSAYENLKKALEEKHIPLQVDELSMIPQNSIPITEVESARKILALMDELEEHDDIQNVYANFDIPDDIIAKAQET